jgi:signal peptidase
MVSPAQLVRRVGYIVLLVATLVAAWLLLPGVFGGHVAYVEVTGHSMDPTLGNGDLVAVREHPHYRIGEVIAYRIPNGEFGAGRTVIHRIVGGNEHSGFLTRGDNRTTDDMWHPTPTDIKGARWFRIPGIGATLDRLRSPIGVAAFAALLSIFAILALIPKSPTATVDNEPQPPPTSVPPVQPRPLTTPTDREPITTGRTH